MMQVSLDQLIAEASPLTDDQIEGFLHGLEHTLPSAASIVRQIIRQKDEEIASLRPSFSEAITREDPDTAFHGPTYSPKDYPRLKGQKKLIRQLMSNGAFWTLRQLEERTGFLSTSISARIRELPHEKREVGRGLWEYRLLPA